MPQYFAHFTDSTNQTNQMRIIQLIIYVKKSFEIFQRNNLELYLDISRNYG